MGKTGKKKRFEKKTIKSDMTTTQMLLTVIGTIMSVSGLFLAGVGTFASFVYLVYLWGGTGVIFSVALWSALKLWLWMVPGGMLIFFVSLLVFAWAEK